MCLGQVQLCPKHWTENREKSKNEKDANLTAKINVTFLIQSLQFISSIAGYLIGVGGSIPEVSILAVQSLVLSIGPCVDKINTKIRWIHHMLDHIQGT